MSTISCDVFILGGGPSGVSCALGLADSGLRVVLADKAAFPRDKICGDAMSPDVIKQLSKISGSLRERFYASAQKEFIRGIRIFDPIGRGANLDLNLSGKGSNEGYVMPRLEFDQLMMEELKSRSSVQIMEGVSVTKLHREKEGIRVESSAGEFHCRMYVGADGAQSISNKQLAGYEIDRNHHCAAMRVYYENVDFPEGRERIELHFVQGVLPGYLWIFPMAGNRANVGIGMLSSALTEKKVNLRQEMEKLIREDERFSPRFANARPLETPKGFGIPVGAKRRPLSGNHFLLTGDAASLVDPLSGEGIGNALRSGRFAAKQILACFENNRFDAEFNRDYDKVLYKMLMPEFKISRFMQRVFHYPAGIKMFVGFALKSERYRRFLSYLLESNFFSEWNRPSYYLKGFKKV